MELLKYNERFSNIATVLIVGFYWLPAIFIFVETECQLGK